MSDLADALSDQAGRKVIDKTGLTGHADIKLKWSDDVNDQQGGIDVISVFTAIEEQLRTQAPALQRPRRCPRHRSNAEMPTAD